MTIHSLLAFLPDYLWFFAYGLICGYFLKLWQFAKNEFPLAILFFYIYSLWLICLVIWIVMQLNSLQAWGVFGAAVLSAHFLPSPHVPLAYVQRKRAEARWRAQARQWQAQQERMNAYRQAQFKLWEEQFLREKIIREQAERAYRTRQQQRQQYSRQQSSYSQGSRPFQPQIPAKQSYEQVLGLSVGWTQAELKKAYQKAAHKTHPDRWIGEPEHVRKAKEEEYKTIQKAYRNLKGKRLA
jgi:hypothetical protein